MQAFRNAAKPLMVVVAFTFFAWLVVDLSGITGGTGLLTKTSVGKVNGRASTRAPTSPWCSRASTPASGRRPARWASRTTSRSGIRSGSSSSRTACSRRSTSGAASRSARTRSWRPCGTRRRPSSRRSPSSRPTASSTWASTSAGSRRASRQQYLPSLEAQYREQLQRSKLLRVVTADVYLSDAALWEQFRDEHEKVKIGLTAIIAAQRRPRLRGQAERRRDRARTTRRTWTTSSGPPRPTSASSRCPGSPRAADTAAARARADSVRAEIAGGAPFAEVARRESADSVSAAQGGDLGEWTRGAMDAAFDSAAFALPLNTLSQPVLSQFGYHLIEVTSRKGDKAKGRHILIPIEVAGAHRDQLDAQADSLEKLGAEKADPAALDTVARALKLPIGKSGPVQEGTKVQLGQSRRAGCRRLGLRGQAGRHQPGHRDLDRLLRLPARQPAGGRRPAAGGRSGRPSPAEARAEKKLERGPEAGAGLPEAARGGRHAWPPWPTR